MEASSSNTGFIQKQPIIRNQFHDDTSLQRIVKRMSPCPIAYTVSSMLTVLVFLPHSILDQISPEAARLGDEVLSQQVLDWVTDAERNQPYLRGSGRDAFGKPKSELVVGEGWRKLQDFGFEKGLACYLPCVRSICLHEKTELLLLTTTRILAPIPVLSNSSDATSGRRPAPTPSARPRCKMVLLAYSNATSPRKRVSPQQSARCSKTPTTTSLPATHPRPGLVGNG